MTGTHLFTSESVSEGHPDKVSDRISDEVLDAALRLDPRARVAVETLVTRDLCVVAGEVTLEHRLDYERIAREAVRAIGYAGGDFDPDEMAVLVKVHRQAPEIADAVGGGEGAGDQGLMFGFACRETETLMPAPIHVAHRIVEALARLRHGGDRRLGPDAKSQVTLQYQDGRPVRAATVVVSQMHAAEVGDDELRAIIEPVVREALPAGWFDSHTELLVNPSGSFVKGGPGCDTGVTGRKIVVDTYGGAAPHGGGAFSGKDPTKVDRSATYAARYLAKNVVAAGLADRCLIQLAYAIGHPEPLGVYVDCQGTGRVSGARLGEVLAKEVDLTPTGIRERLGLERPIYARTAAYGHFGRASEPDGGFSWERTDLAETLASSV